MPTNAQHILDFRHDEVTMVSQASAHGRSQLKPKKSEVGPYTEKVLE